MANTATDAQINEFFADIGPLGWGTKTTDYSALKAVLMNKWTPEKAAEMHRTYYALYNDLYRKLDPLVRGLGDDSFGDFLAHIIGMGREEYERSMADPAHAVARAKNLDFEESFAYCLPLKQDYLQRQPEHYAVRTADLISQLEVGLRDWRYEPVKPVVEELIGVLKPAAEGKPHAVLPLAPKAVALAQQLEEFSDELFKGAGWGIAATPLNSHWAIRNMMKDMENYLLPA